MNRLLLCLALALPLAAAETPFDPSVEKLPPGFRGNDFKAVFAAMLPPVKDEFETTEQYAKRKSAVPGGIYAFRVAKPSIRYDADAGAYNVQILTGASAEGKGSLIELAMDVKSGGTYKAGNAFGAMVTVTRIETHQWGILTDRPAYTRVEMTYAVPPERARELKDRLAVVVVAKVGADSLLPALEPGSGATGFSYTKATVRSPSDTTTYEYAFRGLVQELWLFDAESGEVLQKQPAAKLLPPVLPQSTYAIAVRLRKGQTRAEVAKSAAPATPAITMEGAREIWIFEDASVLRLEFENDKLVGRFLDGKPLKLQ